MQDLAIFAADSEYSLPVAYLFLAGAIVFETLAGGVFLRMTDGYTKMLPLAAMVASYGIVFVLAAQALTVLPLSVGYPIWAGGCAIGTAIVGVLAFSERKTFTKALGIALVVLGIVVLEI